MNKLHIRQAVADDAADLLAYMEEIGGQTDYLLFGSEGVGLSEAEERTFLTRLQNSDRQAMFVALRDDRIIGSCHLSSRGRPRVQHTATLGMSVLKTFWGQGVGSALLTEAITWAKARGIEQITLEVRSDNDRALGLYEKFGFETYGHLPRGVKIRDQYYDLKQMILFLDPV